jgi:hypothetical protein
MLQGLATGLYLFISLVEGIAKSVVSNPQGYYVVPTPYINLHLILNLFSSTFALATMSSVYTISVFEVLIFARIMAVYRRNQARARTDPSEGEYTKSLGWTLASALLLLL